MTGAEVMDIINLICEKAGLVVTSASELIPSLARYEVASNIASLIFYTVYILAVIGYSMFIIRWHYKIKHKGGDEDDLFVWDVLLLIVVVIGIFIVMNFTGTISDMLGWMITPETQFIKWVLKIIT